MLAALRVDETILILAHQSKYDIYDRSMNLDNCEVKRNFTPLLARLTALGHKTDALMLKIYFSQYFLLTILTIENMLRNDLNF